MAFGDFTVTRASTKNVLGSAGLYVSVANNTPAFEFNTDGTYRGLLVEPGATNLMTYSQEFDNGAWTKQEITITPNATTAPDGTTTADLAVVTAVLGTHQIARTGLASGAYTASVFAKANGYDTIEFLLNGGTNGALFNLTTGAITSVGTSTNVIEEYPDGWYRCSVYSSVAGTDYRIYIPTSNAAFTGDGTSGVYLWQAQLETGSVATSYIVTTGSTASRVADVVSLTGASSLIGQTSGTLYVEFETRNPSSVGRLFQIDDGTDDNRIVFLRDADNTFAAITSVATVVQTNIITSANLTGVQKLGFGYEVNNFALYLLGSLVGTDVSGTVPATSSVRIGHESTGVSQFNGWIRSVALFPTRLANATLASITTL